MSRVEFVSQSYEMSDQLPDVIFRAYDIRGIVTENLTSPVVYAIGLSLGTEALLRDAKYITVARDGRLSSPELQKALISGILATGCNVTDLGAVPTPLLYYATHVLDSGAGAVVTGSHNPPQYNGIKIVLDQKTLVDSDIQTLKQRIVDRAFSRGTGDYRQLDIVPRYLDDVVQRVKLQKPLKVVVDCANAIAGVVMPPLLARLGCDVIPLYCDVDGTFPNHHPDPSELKNLTTLIKTVEQQQADIGLAFDGDGDRLGVVTNKGQVIWPDTQLMLYAKDILSRNPGANIVYDVKCTHHLKPLIETHEGHAIMWRTGHSLIKQKMLETEALLAGEMSGHIYFKERWYGFDDALYTAARLLEILSATSVDAETIFNALPKSISTPELRVDISESKKFAYMEKFVQDANFPDGQACKIDGLRIDFANGWGLLRASNTTACLILRFEAESKNYLSDIQDQFRQQMLAIDSELILPF